MLVEVPVSSMKTRRSGSSSVWFCAHSVRAAATSGRSCSAARTVFFEADAMAVEEPPDRPKPCLVPAIIEQTALDFLQRQIGLAPHQLKQPLLMSLERRPALALVRFRRDAAGLPPPLRPPDRRRDSDHELLRRSRCRRSTLNHVDHSNSQVGRIAHRRPPQLKKASESYSQPKGNPLDSQKVETALRRRSSDDCAP